MSWSFAEVLHPGHVVDFQLGLRSQHSPAQSGFQPCRPRPFGCNLSRAVKLESQGPLDLATPPEI